MDYWKECISIAAEECGVYLTEEQLIYIADSVEGGHENYGMAHGYDVIGNHADTQAQNELRALKRQMQAEEDWKLLTRPCLTCTTTGSVLDVWGRDQVCPDCDGNGRVRF